MYIINSSYTSCYPKPLRTSAGFQTSQWLRLKITTISWKILISTMYLGRLELEQHKYSSIKILNNYVLNLSNSSQLLFDSVTVLKHIY